MAYPSAPLPPVGESSSQAPGTHLDVELDDDSFALTPEQASQVDRFREELRACETDMERYELCVQKRDELLDRHAGLQLLVSTCELIMSTECPTYRRRKQTGARDSGKEDDIEEWHRFLGIATEGDRIRSHCLPALKEIARCWGRQIIQHYKWASRGEKYCNQLRAAARKVPRWDDAVMGLNWSILQRSQNVRRRPIKASPNPIEQHDLERLKTWSQDPSLYKKLPIKDVPCGLGFDAFGLLVHEDFAAVLPQVDGAGSLGSSASPEDYFDTTKSPIPIGTTSIDLQGAKDLEELNQTALDSIMSEAIDSFPFLAECADEDPIVREAIDAFFTEYANGTSCDQSVAGPSPAPHSPGCVNPTLGPSTILKIPDQRDSDTDGTVAEDRQDNPANTVPDRSSRMALRARIPLSYRELASSRGAKSRAAKPREGRPSPAEVPEMPSDCCPKVPPSLQLTLANPFLFSRETADLFFPFLGQLCREHLQCYVELRYHTEEAQAASLTKIAKITEHPDASSRRRRASLPDITQSKRPRLDTPLAFSRGPRVPEDRPAHDHIPNDAYRQRALAELEQATPLRGSHGEKTNHLVRKLLANVQHPNTESSRGAVEAVFCTGEEAARAVETRSFGDAPIITTNQQPFEWGEKGRPIEQFFRRFCMFDLSVSVQIPSRPCKKQSFEARKLGEVKDQFLDQKDTSDPWNILDLQSPIQSILPKFLDGEDCGLLLDVRNTVLMEGSAERVTASLEKWTEWKDVDKWALLSQGGHHTAPHMDSHGYSTWITAQEGPLGFGWMSCPTEEELDGWMAEPHRYTGGRWRYIILKPGQTVFFREGTIHFVFRVRAHQTLALGGHILQWSGIQRWIRVVLAELKNPAITNEEMNATAPKLVRVVARLVKAKVNEARVEELGGEDEVSRFLKFVEEFERLYNVARRPTRRRLPK